MMANPQSATSEPQSQNQSAMPTPVLEYVKKYTDEAVKKGLAPKPPPPITDTYHMFGQTCHQDDVIIRPLEKQGIKRLHPENYKKKDELKKITLSILCNFLDLLDILVKCGLSPVRDEKIEDLNLLFIHMHHLINEFRPHQARETLKVMMSLQKKNLIEAGDCLGKNIEKASEILKQSSEEVNSLIAKHKEAARNHSSQEEMMDIDHILTSNTSAVSANSSETRTMQFESSQDKDMLLCNLLDNIKE